MIHRLSLVALLCSIVLLSPACKSRTGLEGKYEAATPSTISLVLESSGQGTWVTAEDTMNIRWETKGDRVMLHTRAGGAIEGRAVPGGLRFTLPGTGDMTFKRLKE